MLAEQGFEAVDMISVIIVLTIKYYYNNDTTLLYATFRFQQSTQCRSSNIHYEPDENNIHVCGTIEFMPEAEAYLYDIKFLGIDNQKAHTLFKNIFPDSTLNVGIYRSCKSCISLFSHRDKVSTIYITREGYEEDAKIAQEKVFQEFHLIRDYGDEFIELPDGTKHYLSPKANEADVIIPKTDPTNNNTCKNSV
ncbi:hypothetical protein [Pseudobacteroides cellulosolvens]|uniref:Uncharacterized protein n=1 Tax=Pseudobacteroides cellulosolvens ATCC 35603 = DSM 2933 TaxID=398512 RepID=A0A0L6JIB9_9FIRM|nr:hypothetical protein [Pseudobacteroides cellulosolvens]KNY25470.1 hypothetical protein Bccel_0730 [Pseudobacteroides cellulosolvens ATCC 35603 = DSM 2933]